MRPVLSLCGNTHKTYSQFLHWNEMVTVHGPSVRWHWFCMWHVDAVSSPARFLSRIVGEHIARPLAFRRFPKSFSNVCMTHVWPWSNHCSSLILKWNTFDTCPDHIQGVLKIRLDIICASILGRWANPLPTWDIKNDDCQELVSRFIHISSYFPTLPLARIWETSESWNYFSIQWSKMQFSLYFLLYLIFLSILQPVYHKSLAGSSLKNRNRRAVNLILIVDF